MISASSGLTFVHSLEKKKAEIGYYSYHLYAIKLHCTVVTVEACRHDIMLSAFGLWSSTKKKKIRAQKCCFYCQHFLFRVEVLFFKCCNVCK